MFLSCVFLFLLRARWGNTVRMKVVPCHFAAGRTIQRNNIRKVNFNHNRAHNEFDRKNYTALFLMAQEDSLHSLKRPPAYLDARSDVQVRMGFCVQPGLKCSSQGLDLNFRKWGG